MGIMAEGLPPTAVLQGGEGAPFFMAIKYCGGWGYEKHCHDIKEQLEGDENLANLFTYQLFKNTVETGEFEVYLHTTEDRSD